MTWIVCIYPAVCDPPCKNGGHCFQPNQCRCRQNFIGASCENGMHINKKNCIAT